MFGLFRFLGLSFHLSGVVVVGLFSAAAATAAAVVASRVAWNAFLLELVRIFFDVVLC